MHPWDKKYGFSFPPLSLISRVLRKILEEKIDHLIIVTPTWQTWQFVNKSTGQKSSSSRNRVTEISGVEGLRESLQMQGISSNVVKLISHWCNERQVNPFQAPVNYIINVLSEKFDKGLQYITLNPLRSAISEYHVHIKSGKASKSLCFIGRCI